MILDVRKQNCRCWWFNPRKLFNKDLFFQDCIIIYSYSLLLTTILFFKNFYNLSTVKQQILMNGEFWLYEIVIVFYVLFQCMAICIDFIIGFEI